MGSSSQKTILHEYDLLPLLIFKNDKLQVLCLPRKVRAASFCILSRECSMRPSALRLARISLARIMHHVYIKYLVATSICSSHLITSFQTDKSGLS
jgi:hypothetical protein